MARIALTKGQVEAGPGLELLALCQTVTEDGSLGDEEIEQLRQWLEENRSGDLPAIGLLVGLVDAILKDGKVTDIERRELHRALEKVLPPEMRGVAVAQRRIADAELREKAKTEKAEARAQEKERKAQERLRDSPIDHANFMVAGTLHEGRGAIIERHVQAGDKAFLWRDRSNRFSRNAIEIRVPNGMTIGFVPEEDAVNLAPLIDDGALHDAMITKVLSGRRGPIPVVDATLYTADAKVPNLVGQSQVPQSSGSGSPWTTAGTSQSPPIPTSGAAPTSKRSNRLVLVFGLFVAIIIAIAFLRR